MLLVAQIEFHGKSSKQLSLPRMALNICEWSYNQIAGLYITDKNIVLFHFVSSIYTEIMASSSTIWRHKIKAHKYTLQEQGAHNYIPDLNFFLSFYV